MVGLGVFIGTVRGLAIADVFVLLFTLSIGKESCLIHIARLFS